jgi:uncharacterized repeat protein (TIGR01451 family)
MSTCAALIASVCSAQTGSSGIVISQIYGGGGNSGSTLRNDFVELFNRGNTPVTISGWSLQYASALGSSWDRTLLSGVIQPGQYYLVQEAQGNGGTAALPASDASGGINLSAIEGKVALVANTSNLTDSNPSGSQVVDLVGYGSANGSQGSSAAALSNTTAAVRQSAGCTDTRNNLSDFRSGSPNPHNSHSSLNLCSPVSSPSLSMSASHTGNFVQGQSTGYFTLSIKNNGSTATSGTVFSTDTLPVGISATAINGPGWSCSISTLTCSRSDSLAPTTAYPPITLTVSVASDAATGVTNEATFSGGGASPGSANDPVMIIPAFTDITSSDPFLPAIDLLRQSGITTGCQSSPPRYCSPDTIPESQMAVFVIRSVFGSDTFSYTQAPYFSDVPVGSLYFPWIQKMQDLGIGLPCSSGQYCPEAPVTRGIMAVLIIRSRFGSLAPANYPTVPYFTDVPADHPYFAWIQKMKQLGITSGCSVTTYCPDDPVTRGQMAVFIMRGEFNQLLPPATPVVVWASRASASPGQAVGVTIAGQNTNFASGVTQVTGGQGITVSNISVTSSTTLTVQFAISPNAALGPRSITVTTAGEEATLPNGFRVQ